MNMRTEESVIMNMRTEESVIMNMRTEESAIMNMKKRECHSEYEEESAIVRLLGMAGCFSLLAVTYKSKSYLKLIRLKIKYQ